MRLKLVFAALLLTAQIDTTMSEVSASSGTLRDTSEANQSDLLDHLRPVLGSGLVARVDYKSDCSADSENPVPFPPTKIEINQSRERGLAGARQLFRSDPNVSVAEEKPGILHVQIGHVSSAFLKTRLSSVTFDPMQQYNPSEAINKVQHTKEVLSALQHLRMRSPVTITGTILTQPAKNLPHLPVSVQNITVDEFLDLIAKTFNLIVFYGECSNGTKTRSFWIDVAGIQGFEATQ